MKNKFYSKTIKKIQKMESVQPRYQMLGRSGTGKVHFLGFQPLITQMVNTNRNLIISAHAGTGKVKDSIIIVDSYKIKHEKN